MSTFSTFLFARPSLIEGVARILDFSGSLNVYNESHAVKEADAHALRADWEVVGADLRAAMKTYEYLTRAPNGAEGTTRSSSYRHTSG